MQFSPRNIQFQLLLGGLFAYLILAPFFAKFPYAYILINFVFTFVLLTAMFTLEKSRTLKIVSIVVLLTTLFPLWLNLFGIIEISETFTYTLLAIYLGIIVCSLFVRVFSAKKVSANVLYAALSLYVLIGMIWGTLYALLDRVVPGSFRGWIVDLPNIAEMRFHGFIYFSFATQTTLGYGDVTPATLQSAALCQTEAIMGQFFISVLIAQLVGIHIAERMRRDA